MLVLQVVLRIQDEGQEGHPDEHPVLHLPKVGGAGVGIDRGADLVHPRQRVQDHHVGRRAVHEALVDDVATLWERVVERERGAV